MSYFAKFKTAINNPKEAIRYIISGSSFKFDESKYIPLYNSQKKYNSANSKYPIYFDFIKRILRDSISDKSLKKRFFKNTNSISENEMKLILKENVSNTILAGIDWPQKAHTMIGLIRLENLQFCVEDVLKNKINGDFIECGVWRGGATIFMRLILKKYKIQDKIVYAADSFEGLPPPDPEKFPEDEKSKFHTMNVTKVDLDEVKENFKLYDVLDDGVFFMKGWFKDSLKDTPFQKLSILRLDGDMYESTWEILENLYDKLSIGGYAIVDDYNLAPCRSAVDDFRKQYAIFDEIKEIDGAGIFWKKSK